MHNRPCSFTILVLEEEKVGGIRTCYLKADRLLRITELEKGEILKMNVIDYQLTGREWLGFEEAIYLFDKLENGETKMTRITTYTSELYPGAYWRPLEKIAIEQEHEYVFRNLKKDLKNKYGSTGLFKYCATRLLLLTAKLNGGLTNQMTTQSRIHFNPVYYIQD